LGSLTLGPDASRYWLAGGGVRQARPFHLRWLLPTVCGQNLRAWWVVWLASWPVAAAGMFAWQVQVVGWERAAAATVLLLGLPGVLGPRVVIPVGVDLPATALSLVGVALIQWGDPGGIMAGVFLIGWASTVKEQAPIWSAIWVWSPWPLVMLVVPAVRHLVARPAAEDPLGPKFTEIANHPVRTALAAHSGRWRDGWLMVAPWGVCLAGLYRPDVRIMVTVAAAYALLLVATDTVRLVQHAAGPVLAAASAAVIPIEWLFLACVLHVVWWFKVERV